jgi:uncharacterized protein YhaN
LAFRELAIRRTPGIATPYTLADLCPGINIIYGPNASGKSTSALALHALLWPQPACWPHGALSGLVDLDGSEWHLDFDAGAFRCQRDGADNAHLAIGARDTREQYVLTLHDLLQADNKEFAATILRESAGGYDIDAAVKDRGYSSAPTRPAKVISELGTARKATQVATRAQRELLEQQNRLHGLQLQREASLNAQSRAKLLERAITFHEARAKFEETQRFLDSFAPSIVKLTGQEPTRLSDLRQRLLELRRRRDDEDRSIAAARDLIEQSGLAGIQIREGLVSELRARCQQLQELDSAIKQAKHRMDEAQTQRDGARRRVGDQIDESRLRALQASGLHALVPIVEGFEHARADEKAVAELEQWIGRVVAPPDLDRLREAVSRLNEWLRTPEADPSASGRRTVLLARLGAILVIALSLVLIVVVHWLFVVFAVAGAALLITTLKPEAKPVTTSRLGMQAKFARLEVEQPERWTVEDVEKLLDRLNDRLRKSIVDEEKATRWANLADQRQAALLRREAAEQQRIQTTERYGITVTDSASVSLLAHNLERWQQADGNVETAQAEVKRAASAYAALLSAINRDLDAIGYAPAADHMLLLVEIDRIDQTIHDVNSANTAIVDKQRMLQQQINPEIAQLEQQHRQIFETLGLEENDEQALMGWVSQLDEYRAANVAQTRADQTRATAELALGDNTDLKERTVDDLLAEQTRVGEIANQYQTVNDEIVTIETLVNDAKRKHDLEQALGAEKDALDALASKRDEAHRLASGWELGEFVRAQTRDRDRPQVFHRARQLFSRITYGRYRLEFGDATTAEFRATDTTTNIGHSLDELSSATRVQLLMAVRLEFVEVMEHGPKLPLILDEVLGNSDEHRARAIIEATIEICRTGRQVFYFTAQHDEVVKWTSILEVRGDVAYSTTNLAEVRGLADIERLPVLTIQAAPADEIPAPTGVSHQAYGTVLRVPSIDPWADVGGLHLWYVVTDTDALYHLLSQRVTTWGQLQTLVSYGGGDLLAGFPGIYKRAEARARVIEVALEGWRANHGKPVDRAVLLESGAVSATFIDEVARLTDELGGDASELIDQLNARRVKGLYRSSIERLETYFNETGHLPNGSAPSSGDLRMRALAAVAGGLTNGLIANDDVETLLYTVTSITR